MSLACPKKISSVRRLDLMLRFEFRVFIGGCLLEAGICILEI
jgi:hypothetical protein